MGYRSQSGSRRSGQKFQKSEHQKAKVKTGKTKNGRYIEETPLPSLQDEAQKTLASLDKLGTQTFAISPFSHYFDNWLVNLRQVLAEFEANPAITVDDAFIKERNQVINDVENALAQSRLREAEKEAASKTLAEQNHVLAETDAVYARQTRVLADKGNSEIERLTKQLNGREADLTEVKGMKTSFFGFTKGAKVKKEVEATTKRDAAKTELEVAVKNFRVEQEKLHDLYEKKKQETMGQVQNLEREIVGVDSDFSLALRKDGCNALAASVEAFIKRLSATPSIES
jgi:hypothetical protein